MSFHCFSFIFVVFFWRMDSASERKLLPAVAGSFSLFLDFFLGGASSNSADPVTDGSGGGVFRVPAAAGDPISLECRCRIPRSAWISSRFSFVLLFFSSLLSFSFCRSSWPLYLRWWWLVSPSSGGRRNSLPEAPPQVIPSIWTLITKMIRLPTRSRKSEPEREIKREREVG